MNDLHRLTWDTLRGEGFDEEPTPEGRMPPLPDDITEITDTALMGLFTELTNWGCYAASKLAGASVAEAAAKQNLALVLAQATARADDKSVSGRKILAVADPAYRDAEAAHLRAVSRLRALEMVAGTAEKRAVVVSRELSRRLARYEPNRRNAKWGT